jgi:hypothetical protein
LFLFMYDTTKTSMNESLCLYLERIIDEQE